MSTENEKAGAVEPIVIVVRVLWFTFMLMSIIGWLAEFRGPVQMAGTFLMLLTGGWLAGFEAGKKYRR